jgi:hypothetical protein
MKQTSIQTIKSDAQIFVELLTRSAESLVEAGEFACRALERDIEFIDKVCDLCPDITDEAVRRFIALGQRKLHPSLIFSECPGARRLRRLPYQLQEKFSKEPVPLQVKTEQGWETLQVDLRNLAVSQAAQAFSTDGVRSPAAQRAYIEDQAAKASAPPVSNDVPYRLSGDCLVVLNSCTFTRRELAKILSELEQ